MSKLKLFVLSFIFVFIAAGVTAYVIDRIYTYWFLTDYDVSMRGELGADGIDSFYIISSISTLLLWFVIYPLVLIVVHAWEKKLECNIPPKGFFRRQLFIMSLSLPAPIVVFTCNYLLYGISTQEPMRDYIHTTVTPLVSVYIGLSLALLWCRGSKRIEQCRLL